MSKSKKIEYINNIINNITRKTDFLEAGNLTPQNIEKYSKEIFQNLTMLDSYSRKDISTYLNQEVDIILDKIRQYNGRNVINPIISKEALNLLKQFKNKYSNKDNTNLIKKNFDLSNKEIEEGKTRDEYQQQGGSQIKISAKKDKLQSMMSFTPPYTNQRTRLRTTKKALKDLLSYVNKTHDGQNNPIKKTYKTITDICDEFIRITKNSPINNKQEIVNFLNDFKKPYNSRFKIKQNKKAPKKALEFLKNYIQENINRCIVILHPNTQEFNHQIQSLAQEFDNINVKKISKKQTRELANKLVIATNLIADPTTRNQHKKAAEQLLKNANKATFNARNTAKKLKTLINKLNSSQNVELRNLNLNWEEKEEKIPLLENVRKSTVTITDGRNSKQAEQKVKIHITADQNIDDSSHAGIAAAAADAASIKFKKIYFTGNNFNTLEFMRNCFTHLNKIGSSNKLYQLLQNFNKNVKKEHINILQKKDLDELATLYKILKDAINNLSNNSFENEKDRYFNNILNDFLEHIRSLNIPELSEYPRQLSKIEQKTNADKEVKTPTKELNIDDSSHAGIAAAAADAPHTRIKFEFQAEEIETPILKTKTTPGEENPLAKLDELLAISKHQNRKESRETRNKILSEIQTLNTIYNLGLESNIQTLENLTKERGLKGKSKTQKTKGLSKLELMQKEVNNIALTLLPDYIEDPFKKDFLNENMQLIKTADNQNISMLVMKINTEKMDRAAAGSFVMDIKDLATQNNEINYCDFIKKYSKITIIYENSGAEAGNVKAAYNISKSEVIRNHNNIAEYLNNKGVSIKDEFIKNKIQIILEHFPLLLTTSYARFEDTSAVGKNTNPMAQTLPIIQSVNDLLNNDGSLNAQSQTYKTLAELEKQVAQDMLDMNIGTEATQQSLRMIIFQNNVRLETDNPDITVAGIKINQDQRNGQSDNQIKDNLEHAAKSNPTREEFARVTTHLTHGTQTRGENVAKLDINEIVKNMQKESKTPSPPLLLNNTAQATAFVASPDAAVRIHAEHTRQSISKTKEILESPKSSAKNRAEAVSSLTTNLQEFKIKEDRRNPASVTKADQKAIENLATIAKDAVNDQSPKVQQAGAELSVSTMKAAKKASNIAKKAGTKEGRQVSNKFTNMHSQLENLLAGGAPNAAGGAATRRTEELRSKPPSRPAPKRPVDSEANNPSSKLEHAKKPRIAKKDRRKAQFRPKFNEDGNKGQNR